MARPLLVPTAFASALFATAPALAAEANVPTLPIEEPIATDVIPVEAAKALESLSEPLPADLTEGLVPLATRAAGNARLPLYDDGAIMTKGCGNCR